VENFLEKTIDIVLMVIYNVSINLIKGASMKESERLRKENDELQAKIEQQLEEIIKLMKEK
jgi:formiminotetrahydrofolate cyclodeaminase